MFDIEALANAPADGPMSTERPVCPEGEYTMMVDTLGPNGIKDWFREIKRGDGSDALIIAIPCVVLDDGVKAKLKRDKVIVPAEQWADLDAGKLSSKEGDNVLIGQLRNALGQNNQPGWTLTALAGQGPFRGMVKHQAGQNGTFAKVNRVSKIA
jgi:hypothetical protein